MAITLRLTKEDEEKLNFLETALKINTRTKVFKFCLNKTYEMLKEVK